jgi:arylformamidase
MQQSSDSLSELSGLIGQSKVIDLTPLLENGIPRWPTHPPLIINQTVTHEHDGYYCQTVFMPEHCGTHVDAPYHVHADMPEYTIEHVKPESLLGKCTVIDLSDRDWQPGERASRADIETALRRMGTDIEQDDIVLVNFGWLEKYWTASGEWKHYAYNQPGMTEDLAEYFIDKGVRAVGTDTVAVGTPVKDGAAERCFVHERVLRKSIYLIECLDNLKKLPPKCYFMALPLKLHRGSGSPIRAIALIP